MDREKENKRDRLDVRLGDRKGRTQRVSDGETEKEVSAMLEGYDFGVSDRDEERSPPKLEIASGYKRSLPSPQPLSHLTLPPHAMDISSVRFRPVPVMAQAEMTSTHGHPRPNLPDWGKVNKSSRKRCQDNVIIVTILCYHVSLLIYQKGDQGGGVSYIFFIKPTFNRNYYILDCRPKLRTAMIGFLILNWA